MTPPFILLASLLAVSGGVRAWTSRETPRRRTGPNLFVRARRRFFLLLPCWLLLPGALSAQTNFAVLTREHADFRILYAPGATQQLSLVLRDQDRGVNLASNEVILVAKDAARLTLPPGTPFGNGGAPLWILPQSQNVNLLYLGVSAEGIPAGVFDGLLSVRLKRFDGPGYLMAWQATGPGQFNIRLNTRDGLGANDAFTPLIGSHEHFNWGFSTTGVYSVTFEVTGRRSGEATNLASLETTFVFHVQPVPAPTNFLTWQRSIWPPGFNPPTTLADADPDGDGAPNLLEYATGSSPTNAASMNGAVAFEFHTANGERRGAFSFLRYWPALDLEWLPLVADSPAGPWVPLSGLPEVVPHAPLTDRARFSDDASAASYVHRFFQLQVRLR